jgi:hypothetical protein
MEAVYDILEPKDVIMVITRLLEDAGAATATVGGTLGFRIHGEGGGDWIVDLATPGGRWQRPADPAAVERCDTTIFAEGQVFGRLLTHPEDLEADVKSGQLEVTGDRALWTRLGRVLSARGDLLQQRINQRRS